MKVIHQPPEAIPTVLMVDDDKANLESFKSSFRRDAKVLVAENGQDAISLLDSNEVHVLITDQRMPGIKGDELLCIVKERFPLVRRIIATGYADIEAIINAVNEGGLMGYISKPWKYEEVKAMILIGFIAYQKESKTKQYIQELESNNTKLEFALRQRLLS